ncbi:MAG: hypothetical protein B6I19_00680 [Bacteroidetes bacterium 4572_114]|nr:MAG: hypothetical protein B6I19_00680 [Bacteroidetes bacterium 4572_114]
MFGLTAKSAIRPEAKAGPIPRHFNPEKVSDFKVSDFSSSPFFFFLASTLNDAKMNNAVIKKVVIFITPNRLIPVWLPCSFCCIIEIVFSMK